MENKKEKWEIKYESYMNGGLEKEEIKLKERYENKEIDIKEYRKEQKRLEKIKTNLPKVANLVGLKNELDDLKNEIEKELLNRYNNEQSEKQREQLDKKIEESDKENKELLMKIDAAKSKLKDEKLSDDDRKNIEIQLGKDESKLTKNNEQFLELNEKRKNQKSISDKSELADMSSKDLKRNYQKICMKISRNNFYANRLIKGYDIETIKTSEQKADWNNRTYDLDVKKLIAKGKDAQKLKSLKETAKEENEKNTTKGKAMVEVSEFDKKHPRLAKIKNFFANIKNKIMKKEKYEELKLYDTPDNQEPSLNEKSEGVEDKPKIKEEKENQIHENKRESFMKRLKNMDEYEIADIAEKGLEGIKQERLSEAKKKLQENKEKHANGMTADEKKYWDDQRKSIDNGSR